MKALEHGGPKAAASTMESLGWGPEEVEEFKQLMQQQEQGQQQQQEQPKQSLAVAALEQIYQMAESLEMLDDPRIKNAFQIIYVDLHQSMKAM